LKCLKIQKLLQMSFEPHHTNTLILSLVIFTIFSMILLSIVVMCMDAMIDDQISDIYFLQKKRRGRGKRRGRSKSL